MKNIISFLCVVVLVVSFAGCGKNGLSNPQTSQQGETQLDLEKKELSDEKLAESVAKNLGVADKDSIEYDVSEIYYWESAERYFKNITFTENGETVAGASVDPYTGELLRNIWLYDSSK